MKLQRRRRQSPTMTIRDQPHESELCGVFSSLVLEAHFVLHSLTQRQMCWNLPYDHRLAPSVSWYGSWIGCLISDKLRSKGTVRELEVDLDEAPRVARALAFAAYAVEYDEQGGVRLAR